jgi:hypothetical protein
MSTLDLIIDFLTKHWEGLASILLSAVSIGIAICSARSTSKDASRQISSVKELGEIQAEASLLSLDMEIQKVEAQLQQKRNEHNETRALRIQEEIEEMNRKASGINWSMRPNFSAITKSKEDKLRDDIKYLTDLKTRLSNIRQRMMKYRKEEKKV